PRSRVASTRSHARQMAAIKASIAPSRRPVLAPTVDSRHRRLAHRPARCALEALRQLLSKPPIQSCGDAPGASRSTPKRISARLTTLRKTRPSSTSSSQLTPLPPPTNRRPLGHVLPRQFLAGGDYARVC